MFYRILANTLINGLILFVLAKYFPQLGFAINPADKVGIESMLVIGFLFQLIYIIMRGVIKLIALPLNILSLGLLGIVINLAMFYFFAYIVNTLNIGLSIQLGGYFQVFLLSIVIAILNILIKK